MNKEGYVDRFLSSIPYQLKVTMIIQSIKSINKVDSIGKDACQPFWDYLGKNDK